MSASRAVDPSGRATSTADSSRTSQYSATRTPTPASPWLVVIHCGMSLPSEVNSRSL